MTINTNQKPDTYKGIKAVIPTMKRFNENYKFKKIKNPKFKKHLTFSIWLLE